MPRTGQNDVFLTRRTTCIGLPVVVNSAYGQILIRYRGGEMMENNISLNGCRRLDYLGDQPYTDARGPGERPPGRGDRGSSADGGFPALR